MDDDHASRAAGGSQHVLVDDSGTIIAAVVITQHADHVELNNVAVDPSRQRQGLGRRLVELAAELGREAGVTEIRLYTNARMSDNLRFYPALGFEETERRSSGGYDRVYFRRKI
jgi:ribosomal protein S18 acetylase RimI-like enzyme